MTNFPASQYICIVKRKKKISQLKLVETIQQKKLFKKLVNIISNTKKKYPNNYIFRTSFNDHDGGILCDWIILMAQNITRGAIFKIEFTVAAFQHFNPTVSSITEKWIPKVWMNEHLLTTGYVLDALTHIKVSGASVTDGKRTSHVITTRCCHAPRSAKKISIIIIFTRTDLAQYFLLYNVLNVRKSKLWWWTRVFSSGLFANKKNYAYLFHLTALLLVNNIKH